MKKFKNQSGNALWFILVAIGLLGLLTVMMSRSSSTSNETGIYEQNVIRANTILSYAKGLEGAVQSLLSRGCSENEISFETTQMNGETNAFPPNSYANTNSPPYKSCHVFEAAGAGMKYQKNTDLFQNGTWDDHINGFMGKADIIGVGTNGTDLSQELYWLVELPNNINRADFCKTINKLVSFTDPTPPVTEISSSPHFNGTFSSPAEFINIANLDRKTSGCVNFTSDTTRYEFYHVLIAR